MRNALLLVHILLAIAVGCAVAKEDARALKGRHHWHHHHHRRRKKNDNPTYPPTDSNINHLTSSSYIKQTAVPLQNEMRKRLPPLEWDNTLETQATSWAQHRCPYESGQEPPHSPKGSSWRPKQPKGTPQIEENIAEITVSNQDMLLGSTPLPEGMVQLWKNEGPQGAHYKTIINNKLSKVGCGAHICNTGNQFQYFFVCHYGG